MKPPPAIWRSRLAFFCGGPHQTSSPRTRTCLQATGGYVNDRAKLVTPGSEQRVGRLTELTAAAEKVRGYLRHFAGQEQALLALQDEVKDLRQNQAPESLRARQSRHAASRLKDDDWKDFLVDFTGDVDAQITTHLAATAMTFAM